MSASFWPSPVIAALLIALENDRAPSLKLWGDVFITIHPGADVGRALATWARGETPDWREDHAWMTFNQLCAGNAWLDAALSLIPSTWEVRLCRLPNDRGGWATADTGSTRSRLFAKARFMPASVCAVALKIDVTIKARMAALAARDD